jgi:hypothetical protein
MSEVDKIATEWDINAFIEQVDRDWLRVASVYELVFKKGFEQGLKQSDERKMENIKNLMVKPAETFYAMLQKIIPEEDIIQHRIGMDEDADTPTALTVISHKHVQEIPKILDLAGHLELLLFEHGYNCSFWVITDDNMEKSLVEHDFPYLRRNK